jgi:mRNA-degrading endonuclease RelE of RelBE toxin-antitoxin system
MNYNVVATLRFEKELKRLVKKYPSLKAEFRLLVHQINQFPEKGSYLGNHCYKIRLAIASKGKGKSGGSRVITYVYNFKETVYLLTIYDKNEKSDLKATELKEMIENLDLD